MAGAERIELSTHGFGDQWFINQQHTILEDFKVINTYQCPDK